MKKVSITLEKILLMKTCLYKKSAQHSLGSLIQPLAVGQQGAQFRVERCEESVQHGHRFRQKWLVDMTNLASRRAAGGAQPHKLI